MEEFMQSVQRVESGKVCPRAFRAGPLDRTGYWWVKLPIVTESERAQCWNDHFEPVGTSHKKYAYHNCFGASKESHSVGDAPAQSVARQEQVFEEHAYLLLPLCKIPRQSFMKGEPYKEAGWNDEGIKLAHAIPFRPSNKLWHEIENCRIWMQAGVPYYTLLLHYGGFVIPEPGHRRRPGTLRYLMLSPFSVLFSAPLDVFRTTCKLNNLTLDEGMRKLMGVTNYGSNGPRRDWSSCGDGAPGVPMPTRLQQDEGRQQEQQATTTPAKEHNGELQHRGHATDDACT
jgi:hypothetical protein